MTEYHERIYPYPSVVKCCVNCPGFKIEWSAKSMKLHRRVYCKVYNEDITQEMVEKAMDGKFPDFCKLEDAYSYKPLGVK